MLSSIYTARKRVAVFIAMSLLSAFTAGCMTTPVTSMVKLSRISPLEAVPQDMRFAVQSPEVLRVRNGDIVVTLGFDTGDPSSSFVEVYKPLIDEDAQAGDGIALSGNSAQRLAIARFAEADASSMRLAQKRIRAFRKANGSKAGRGSFSVTATGCATAKITDEQLLLTTWLRTAPAEDYFVLTRNIDLRDLLENQGRTVNDIPPCEEPG